MAIKARKPKAVRPGATLGLVAPASPFDTALFEEAVAGLKQLGYSVKYRSDILQREGYLAGSDERRADEILEMFADPEVDAILGVRGGYGSARIVRLLQAKRLRGCLKPFIGYSDLTTLLLHLYRNCGMVVFHGPLLASPGGWSRRTTEQLLSILGDVRPQRSFEAASGDAVASGKASGVLIGGNLTVFAHSIGTPWEVDTKGAILFFEEVNEPVYRIDRALTHLREGGKFAGVKGIVFGDVVNVPEGESATALAEMLGDLLGDLGVPILMGFPVGHGPENVTLPIGIRAEIDADARRLTLLESPVADG